MPVLAFLKVYYPARSAGGGRDTGPKTYSISAIKAWRSGTLPAYVFNKRYGLPDSWITIRVPAFLFSRIGEVCRQKPQSGDVVSSPYAIGLASLGQPLISSATSAQRRRPITPSPCVVNSQYYTHDFCPWTSPCSAPSLDDQGSPGIRLWFPRCRQEPITRSRSV